MNQLIQNLDGKIKIKMGKVSVFIMDFCKTNHYDICSTDQVVQKAFVANQSLRLRCLQDAVTLTPQSQNVTHSIEFHIFC